MDFWFIIYPVIHVFKDLILDTNTVDLGSHSIAFYTLTLWTINTLSKNCSAAFALQWFP